jgi:hypothetical protein
MCSNCEYWYCGRNGGNDKKFGWAECRAIMDGCSEIEVKFFDRDFSEFYVETRNDFCCALWSNSDYDKFSHYPYEEQEADDD